MKQMKTIRNLIVLLTAICFALAVVAFFLPHGVGTVCAIGTVALAALVLILCLVCNRSFSRLGVCGRFAVGVMRLRKT